MKQLTRVTSLTMLMLLYWVVAGAAVSVLPSDAATGVFSFTPIRVEFPSAPGAVTIELSPTVAGSTVTEGNTAQFVPSEAYAPKTRYTVTVKWDGGEHVSSFTSANEIAILYEEDFSNMRVGRFPEGWQIRPNEDATPNYQVVEFPQSASGYALRAFDGGITWGAGGEGHALILGPGLKPLQDPNSKIVIESTIWIDKDAVWRSYLFPAGILWPPYKDTGARSATTPIDHPDLQRHVVHHVYDPANTTIETYFDYAPSVSGNPAYRDGTLRDYPIAGRIHFNIGIYTQGKRSSEVFWEKIRVIELGD